MPVNEQILNEMLESEDQLRKDMLNAISPTGYTVDKTPKNKTFSGWISNEWKANHSFGLGGYIEFTKWDYHSELFICLSFLIWDMGFTIKSKAKKLKP